jgi:hypothetical protein
MRVALAAAAAVASAAVLASPPGAPASRVRLLCGVERWTVKTLQDRPRLLPPRTTTIHFLVTRPAPTTLPDRRLPFEYHVYTVVASVILIRPEADGDFHVVLEQGQDHMITETPQPTCTAGATPMRRQQMAQARAAIRYCRRAQVTGVAFFDFQHGQTGVAPNAIELHPVLAFRCLSGAVNGSPTTPPAPARTAPSPPASVSNAGKVALRSLTTPVSAGSDATLVVTVPSGTTCSIVVTYKSGPSSAAGLYTQRARNGQIAWTWMVGTRTTSGQWPIDVSCGTAGSLHTSFVVT